MKKNLQQDTAHRHSRTASRKTKGIRIKVSALVVAALASALGGIWFMASEAEPSRVGGSLSAGTDVVGVSAPAMALAEESGMDARQGEASAAAQVTGAESMAVGNMAAESAAFNAPNDGDSLGVARESVYDGTQNRSASAIPAMESPMREWPMPEKSRFSGKTIDYRVVELPPLENGDKPGERREWLIEPDEGYTAHIEEEYRPNAEGELRIVATKEYVANQVLLTLDGETDFESFRKAMEKTGAVVKPPLMELEKGAKIVAVMTSDVSFESVGNLRSAVASCNPSLVAEVDSIVTIDRVPNDARYSSQWGLGKIQAPEAWNIRTDASSVVVAVIDTGVNYNHQDLADNMWVGNSGASASNYRYGMRCIGGVVSGNPLDDNGHGSHCAGIIGAVGNNSTGISGVAWKTKIMACKCLSASGGGSDSDIIRCLAWARQNGAHILSLSFGGSQYNSTMESAFSELRASGIIAVCAAGNSGFNNDLFPHYPSSYGIDNIVAVAASSESDSLADFSCYGKTTVDIAAPGVGILSTINIVGSYDSWNGTSMATPFVSGALALLKAQYPSYSYQQLIQKLYEGGDSLPSLSGKVSTGKRLNVLKALKGSLVSPVPTASRGTYENYVHVSWPSVDGATHYRVYRSESLSGAKTELGPYWQPQTLYHDYSVTQGTTYYYWVCAASSSAGADKSAFGSHAVGYSQARLDAWDPGDDTPGGGTSITPFHQSRWTHGRHTLSASDPHDFFIIQMESGYKYIFETSGELDTYGELFNAPSTNAANRVSYNDDGGTNRNFRLEYTPTASGTYYLRVKTYQASSSGSYTLAYWRETPADIWDPVDNTPDGATLLTPTNMAQTHGPHSLSETDFFDFFRIEMTEGRTYLLESDSLEDMDAELFDSASTNADHLVASSSRNPGLDNLGGFRIEYKPPSSGTYYLRVHISSSFDWVGAYSVKYLWREGKDIVFSPMDETNVVILCTSLWDHVTVFTTNVLIHVRYAWQEADLFELGPVTNCVQVLDSAGRVLLSEPEAFTPRPSHGPWRGGRAMWCGGLPPGAYTMRVALNEDAHGVHSIEECAYENNVCLIPFTIVAPEVSLTSIAVSGADDIPSGGSSNYRCVGTYSDGSSVDVSATWTILSGLEFATVDSSGRVIVRNTEVDREIVLRAEFGDMAAEKAIVIRGIGDGGDGGDPGTASPFPGVVGYPGAQMVVKGVAYINDVPAVPGDWVAACCGNEIRGVACVVADGRVTISVNIAEAGESISFKVWDASEGDSGMIYNCLQTLAGTSEPQGTTDSPIRFDAVLSDPFGLVVAEPLVPPTIVEAAVTVAGNPASTGDILAVFSGDTIVGKAQVSRQTGDGQSSATCRLVMFFSGRKTLSFRLWDGDAGKILETSAMLTLSAGDVQGTAASPYAIDFHPVAPQSCPVLLNSGWNLISFSALPDPPTPANVFAEVSSSIQYVADAFGNLWSPSSGSDGLNEIHIGAGYWVRSSANDVGWVVEGHGDADAEVSLSAGWNLIGYALPREGHVASVLQTALASGNVQYIANQTGDVYPDGALSSMRPGVGYWLRSTSAYALKFDQGGMEIDAGSMAVQSQNESPTHPFGTPSVRMGVPTVFSGVSVMLFGSMAAYGDHLAVLDGSTGEVVSVQPINSEDGSLTFSIMGLTAGSKLHFKVWNSASGLDSPEIFEASEANDLTITNPEDTVTGLVVAITGTKPVYPVVYDLDGKATRTGGGELTQTVEFGGDATDPAISANPGWAFVDWDIGKRTDIRGPLSIMALYDLNDNHLPVHRFYSKNYKGHFFTIDEAEKDGLIANNPNWKYEGPAYRAYTNQAPGTVALHRFYSKSYKGHFFTIDEEEADTIRLTNKNWAYEGIAYYVYPSAVEGSVPVYRFWSKRYRHHFYTTSVEEKDNLIANNPNWAYEGEAFWAIPDNTGNQKAAKGMAIDGNDSNDANADAGTPHSIGQVSPEVKSGVAPWSLATWPDCEPVAIEGKTAVGGLVVEASADAPDSGELDKLGNETFMGAIPLLLALPDGAWRATLRSAQDGTVADEDATGVFGFTLPANGLWHWLRVRNEDDAEATDAFSLWLRAE